MRAVECSSKYSYLGTHETTIHTYSAFETQFNFQFYQMSCLLTGDISRHALTGFVSLWRQTTIQPLFSVRFWTPWKNVITPKKYISLGKTVKLWYVNLVRLQIWLMYHPPRRCSKIRYSLRSVARFSVDFRKVWLTLFIFVCFDNDNYSYDTGHYGCNCLIMASSESILLA